MNTMALSKPALIIRQFREDRKMSQDSLGKATGFSGASVSVWENSTDDIVTPAVYDKLRGVGLDLRQKYPAIIIQKRRGKDHTGKPDLSIKVPKPDGLKIMKQGLDDFSTGFRILNDDLLDLDIQIEASQNHIAGIEARKNELLKIKDEIVKQFNQIIS